MDAKEIVETLDSMKRVLVGGLGIIALYLIIASVLVGTVSLPFAFGGGVDSDGGVGDDSISDVVSEVDNSSDDNDSGVDNSSGSDFVDNESGVNESDVNKSVEEGDMVSEVENESGVNESVPAYMISSEDVSSIEDPDWVVPNVTDSGGSNVSVPNGSYDGPVRVCEASGVSLFDIDDDGLFDVDSRERLDCMSEYPSESFELTSSIVFDVGDDSVDPVGSVGDPFTGTFDGNGFEVSSVEVSGDSSEGVGLFGYVGGSGSVESVLVTDGIVDSENSSGVGLLVGVNEGDVSSVRVSGSVVGDTETGGVVGRNEGVITGVEGDVSVIGGNDVGGVVGSNMGTLEQAYYNTSSRSVSGVINVGGLVGLSESGSVSVARVGSVSVDGRQKIGGVVGSSQGSQLSLIQSDSVSVSGDRQVGGVVGSSQGSQLSAVYHRGSVSGDEDVGGLSGEFDDSSMTISYAVSPVSGSVNRDAVVGVGSNSTLEDVYFDSQRSGVGTSSSAVGLETGQMQGQGAFVNMDGFDFDDVWRVDGNSYPELQVEYPFE